VKTFLTGAAGLLMTVVPLAIAWSDATSFRGIAIGMKQDEAAAALDPQLKAEYSKIGGAALSVESLNFARDGKGCGYAKIENGVVAELALKPCYFGAEDLAVQQVAQEMANAYSIPELAWEAPCRTVIENQKTLDNPPIYGCYVGTTPNQELVIIEDAGNLLLGGKIFISRRSSTPSFN